MPTRTEMVLKLCCYQGFSEASDTPPQKTSKEKCPPKIFLDKHMYVRDFHKFTWMRPWMGFEQNMLVHGWF